MNVRKDNNALAHHNVEIPTQKVVGNVLELWDLMLQNIHIFFGNLL
mgnify:CR=1 FL=1